MAQRPCPHCGESIEMDVEKCPHCGQLDPFPKGQNEWGCAASFFWPIVIIVVVFVVFAIIFWTTRGG